MANNLTTTTANSGQVASLMQTYFSKRLLKVWDKKLVYYEQGYKDKLATMSGKTVRFNGFKKLAAASELSEGLSGDAVILCTRYIESTVKQFGGYVKITDLLDETAAVAMEAGAVERIGQSTAVAIDRFVRNRTISGSDVEYPDPDTTLTSGGIVMSTWYKAMQGGFSTFIFSAGYDDYTTWSSVHNQISDIGDAITGGYGLTFRKLLRASSFLRAQDVEPFDDNFYHGIAHPDVTSLVAYDDADTQTWNQYTTNIPYLKGEVLRGGGVRLMNSTNCYSFLSIAVTGRKGFITTIFGPEAYYVTELNGKYKIYKTSLTPDKSDPMGQFYTVGARGTVGAAVVNPSAGLHIISWT